MTPATTPAPPGDVRDPDSRALLLISERINARIEDIARRLAQTYRDEVVEYRAFTDGVVERDVLPLASEKIRQMLTSLMTETPPAEEEPAEETYRVEPGDTLSSISAETGVTIEELEELNTGAVTPPTNGPSATPRPRAPSCAPPWSASSSSSASPTPCASS